MRKREFCKAIAAFAGTAATGLSFAQGPDDVLKRVLSSGELRVGAVAAAVPYFVKNRETGQWEGFCPDFAHSFAKSLGVKVQFVETTWGNAVLDLQSGKIDVMFGAGPTPARRKVLDFSIPLFHNTFTAVCRKGVTVKDWEQLNKPSMRIAVDLGSNQDAFATARLPKATILRFTQSSEATLAVQSGRADCQALVVLLAEPLVKMQPQVGTMYVPSPVSTSDVTVAVDKGVGDGLLKRLDAWIDQARSKGEIQADILKNMQELVGIPPSSFPSEVKF